MVISGDGGGGRCLAAVNRMAFNAAVVPVMADGWQRGQPT